MQVLARRATPLLSGAKLGECVRWPTECVFCSASDGRCASTFGDGASTSLRS